MLTHEYDSRSTAAVGLSREISGAVEIPSEQAEDVEVVIDWRRSRNGPGPSRLTIEYAASHLVLSSYSDIPGRRGALDAVHMERYKCPPTPEQLVESLRRFTSRRNVEVCLIIANPRTIVRHFAVEALPARQQSAAALWQGQRLVPFPLTEREALFGLQYETSADRKSAVTLIAMPREDAAPIIAALSRLRWAISGIHIVGGICPPRSRVIDEATAKVVWTEDRGTFSVFHGQQAVFHYNLGPMPAAPAGLAQSADGEALDVWRQWITSLGVAVTDALDFHLINVGPDKLPKRVSIYGLPEAAAPFLADWGERFPEGAQIVDPFDQDYDKLPTEIGTWLKQNPGILAPSILANRYGGAVDLTPQDLVRDRVGRRRLRVARIACLSSLVASIVVAGIGWRDYSEQKSKTQVAHQNLTQLTGSPVHQRYSSVVNVLTERRALLERATMPGHYASPWLRTVFATVPDEVSLTQTHVTLGGGSVDSGLIIFDGMLSADGPPHALTYRDWLSRLNQTEGFEQASLTSERSIEWHSRKRSVFTIQVKRQASLSLAGGPQP